MDALPAKPIFSDPPLETEAPQRPFRVTGLVSLLLGLLSISMLASGALLFLPILAIVFALIALRPERDPQVIPTGRTLAVIGASLALFFASWAVARGMVQKHYLADSGERFARNWLAVLEDGQREFAYELTLPPSRRQLESMSLKEFYRNNSATTEAFQGFLSEDPIVAILEAEAPLDWELTNIRGPRRMNGADLTTFRFTDRSGQIESPVDVVLVRAPPASPTSVPEKSSADPEPPPAAQWHVYDSSFAR